ncbi:MAG: hypothetical protein R3194_03435, partial [Limnobacter sp.]|nr:hypothetical protein [Limnobacter sp.]
QARYLDLSGEFPNGDPAVVRAYFVEKNEHLFEVVLMGAQSQLTDVAETQWFTGFKWLRN